MSEQATQQTTQTTAPAAPTTPPQQTTAQPPEKTFTQADVDSIVGKRLAKAMKGMPEPEELTEFRTWKESKQTDKERWDTLTKERDTARTELTAAQAKLEQYEREKFLVGKGVPAEDVDYYAFKIGKLVTDTVEFEAAATQFIKEHTPKEPTQGQSGARVDFTAPLSGGGHPMTLNERINNKLRGL